MFEPTWISSVPYYYVIAKKWHLRSDYDVYEYEAPINPFKIAYVSPDQITRFTGRPLPLWRNNKDKIGNVSGGNWDKREELVIENEYENSRWLYELIFVGEYNDSIFHTCFREHFNNGVPWKDTEFIQKNIERINKGFTGWKQSNNEKQLMKTCSYMDALYQTIIDKGYKTQVQLGKRFLQSRLNEVLVDISRDGKLLLVDNRHRLSMAKVMNLESIPISFLVRHRQWMQHRDRAYLNKFSNTHPDFCEFTK